MASVIEPAQELIRRPSRAGTDDYGPVLGVLKDWLTGRAVPHRRWLLGRGSSDSKLAAAMFCHIAADLLSWAAELHSGLAVLLDVDEHTGGFGGARAYLADEVAVRPAGVIERPAQSFLADQATLDA
ncbi:hypothetical protein [Streptomyces sp. NPDC056255]|uniref:hypothetical protein n=1 Tax=Streptomyces sp. NPDC056255 TaxID=3345764 RepID=UPI0035E369A5